MNYLFKKIENELTKNAHNINKNIEWKNYKINMTY